MSLIIVSNPSGRRTAKRARRNSDAARSRALRQGAMSESRAWGRIYDIAMELRRGAAGKVLDRAEELRSIALEMQSQVHRGIHTNPPKGGLMSEHVRAIVYQHVDDDRLYVHGFGDANIRLSGGDDTVTIRGMKSRTDVCMYALPNGSIAVQGGHGQRLWKNFK